MRVAELTGPPSIYIYIYIYIMCCPSTVTDLYHVGKESKWNDMRMGIRRVSSIQSWCNTCNSDTAIPMAVSMIGGLHGTAPISHTRDPLHPLSGLFGICAGAVKSSPLNSKSPLIVCNMLKFYPFLRRKQHSLHHFINFVLIKLLLMAKYTFIIWSKCIVCDFSLSKFWSSPCKEDLNCDI